MTITITVGTIIAVDATDTTAQGTSVAIDVPDNGTTTGQPPMLLLGLLLAGSRLRRMG